MQDSSENSYTFYYQVVINRSGETTVRNVTVSAQDPDQARLAADYIASGVKGWVYDANTVSVVMNPKKKRL